MDEVWPKLSQEERWCVVMRSVGRSKAESAQAIGRNAKWLDNRQRRNPTFRFALEQCSRWSADELHARIHGDMVLAAKAVVLGLMTSSAVSEKDRLAATKLAVRMGEMGGQHSNKRAGSLPCESADSGPS